jgi:hypothetical protein
LWYLPDQEHLEHFYAAFYMNHEKTMASGGGLHVIGVHNKSSISPSVASATNFSAPCHKDAGRMSGMSKDESISETMVLRDVIQRLDDNPARHISPWMDTAEGKMKGIASMMPAQEAEKNDDINTAPGMGRGTGFEGLVDLMLTSHMAFSKYFFCCPGLIVDTYSFQYPKRAWFTGVSIIDASSKHVYHPLPNLPHPPKINFTTALQTGKVTQERPEENKKEEFPKTNDHLENVTSKCCGFTCGVRPNYLRVYAQQNPTSKSTRVVDLALQRAGYKPIRSTYPKSKSWTMCGCVKDIQWHNDPLGHGVPAESTPLLHSSGAQNMIERDVDQPKNNIQMNSKVEVIPPQKVMPLD